MRLKILSITVGIAQIALLSSCVDDAYDLSDIDTTTQLRVDNLVVPVNIDAVTLNDVIKLEEDDNFKIVNIGGQDMYAFTRRGKFHSDSIHIARVYADCPDLESSVGLLIGTPSGETTYDFIYPIKDMSAVEFSFKFENVDDGIHAIKSAKTKPVHFDVSLTVPEIKNEVRCIGFQNLKFQFPKGLTATASAGTYDPVSGVLTVPSLKGEMDDMKIQVTATEIDFEAAGSYLDYATHSFSYDEVFEILGGDLLLTMKSGVPYQEVNFTTYYTITDIEATSFAGEINEKIEGVEMEKVNLSDIPDFLRQDETNILLENPQLYLQVNNPVGAYNLKCETGMKVTSIRPSGLTFYSLEKPVEIGHNNATGKYNFCISPKQPEYPQEEFSKDLKYIKFTGMSQALGNGPIPEELDFELLDPKIPLQTVTDFPIDKDLDSADGVWEFMAPLNLSAGSVIVYSSDEVGWASEDLDALTIETLKVSAMVTSDLPVEVVVTAEPLDADGNVINGVTIEGGKVPAHAENYPLELKMSGSVTRLDGIRYKAYLKADNTTGDITPDMNLEMKEIRATVSGYWTKEL